MRLIIFGNPAYEPDSLALRVGEELVRDGHESRYVGTPFDLLDLVDREPAALDASIIVDTAFGIDEPVLLNDLSKIKTIRFGSLHDFDMAFFLKMLEALGKIRPPRILAVPAGSDPATIVNKAKQLLEAVEMRTS